MRGLVDPVMLRKVLGDSLRESIRSQGLTLAEAARQVGVLPSSLHRYVSGQSLPNSETLIRISRHFGIQLDLDLCRVRHSRAATIYVCAICGTTIRQGTLYYRDEPSPWGRQFRNAEVRHLCAECVKPFQENGNSQPESTNSAQLSLPLTDSLVVIETRVELIDITRQLAQRIIEEPSEIYAITPRQFEDLILDRLRAMKLEPVKVGDTYRKDGGVDIVFCANRQAPFPFLGAVQVKHHRSPSAKVGASTVRELGGVIGSMPFAAGLVVTNTSFTADAYWAARQQKALIRLRDFDDLIRWFSDNFTDDAEWRELPDSIEVCPGIRIPLKHLKPIRS